MKSLDRDAQIKVTGQFTVYDIAFTFHVVVWFLFFIYLYWWKSNAPDMNVANGIHAIWAHLFSGEGYAPPCTWEYKAQSMGQDRNHTGKIEFQGI